MSPLLEENFNESSFFITLPLKRYRLRTGGGSLPLKQSVTFQFRNFLVSRLLPILGGFRSENLVTKKYRFWTQKSVAFGKFGLRKTGFVSISENLVSENKSPFRFRKIWCQKKVRVSVTENLVSETSFSFEISGIEKKYRFWFWKRKNPLVQNCTFPPITW